MSLTGRKLKIWDAASSNVLVVQDGNAADADATTKLDDGFDVGAANPYTGEESERLNFRLQSLNAGPEGKTFEFELDDWTNRNTYNIGPNDRVEFFANAPAAYTTPGGTFPSWHSWSQTADAQTLYFRGFVEKVPRQLNGTDRFVVKAVDPLIWANQIPIQQSIANGVEIPRIILNSPVEDRDHIFSVKAYNRSATAILDKFGIGNEASNEDPIMTLQEIFQYLQAAYQAELFGRNLLTSSGQDLFDATEIAQFSTIKPPRTVLDGVGFAEAVRQLIQSNIPDYNLVCDPRTLVWHFQPTRDIIAGPAATITAVNGAGDYDLDDTAGFATSGDGSYARLISPTDRHKTEVLEVASVADPNITLNSPTFTFAVGDSIVSMYGESDRPPIVLLDLDDATSANLQVDLEGSAAAVKIISTRQKTERKHLTFEGTAEEAFAIEAGWDTEYNTDYRYTKHSTRTADRGSDGDGVVIDEIDNTHANSTWIYFSEEHSAHGIDHRITDNSAGESEWTGAALHVLTQDSDDVEINNLSAIVTFFAASGWMGTAGDSYRRFLIKLDRDLISTVPNLRDEVNNASPDRFQLSTAEVFKPTNANGRFIRGRRYHLKNTTVTDAVRWLDAAGCDPSGFIGGVGGGGMSHTVYPASVESSAPRTHAEQVAYHNFNTSDPNGGFVRAWFRSAPPEQAVHEAGLCALTPPDPPTREVSREIEELQNTVVSARVPAAGFAGLANLYYGHTRELLIPSDLFVNEDQQSRFEAIAETIWRRVSEPHYSGQVPLQGDATWLGMTDLGFRVHFGPGDTGFVGGAATDQRRFWGRCQSIEIDLDNETAAMGFDSRSSGEAFEIDVLERLFVPERVEVNEVKDKVDRHQKFIDCVQKFGSQIAPDARVSSCQTEYNGQSISKKVVTIDPKDAGIGGGETMLGSPEDGSAAGHVGSRSFMPQYQIERDFTGRAFGVRVPTGAIYGGTESGATFTPDAADPVIPVFQPQYNAMVAQEILHAVLGGLNIQTPKPGTIVEVGLGSTTSVIQLATSIPADGRFDDGFIEFFGGGGIARPKYEINSHTATSITLSSAISESIPVTGSAAFLWSKRLPGLDPTDFPNGGIQLTDSDGNLFVLASGSVHSAQVTGGVVELNSAPETLAIEIGDSSGKSTALGDWEFEKGAINGLGAFVMDDHFTTSTTEGGEVGAFGWTISGTGKTNSIPDAQPNHPGMIEFTTDNVANADAALRMDEDALIFGAADIVADYFFEIIDTVDVRYYIGLRESTTTTSNVTEQAILWLDTDASSNWFVRTGDGSSGTEVDTGVAVSAGWWRLTITVNAAATSVTFTINNGTTSASRTVTTTIPQSTANDGVGPVVHIETTKATAMTIRVDRIRLQMTGLDIYSS